MNVEVGIERKRELNHLAHLNWAMESNIKVAWSLFEQFFFHKAGDKTWKDQTFLLQEAIHLT